MREQSTTNPLLSTYIRTGLRAFPGCMACRTPSHGVYKESVSAICRVPSLLPSVFLFSPHPSPLFSLPFPPPPCFNTRGKCLSNDHLVCLFLIFTDKPSNGMEPSEVHFFILCYVTRIYPSYCVWPLFIHFSIALYHSRV